jgi:hypothetical protein
MCGHSMCENREILCPPVGVSWRAASGRLMAMHR